MTKPITSKTSPGLTGIAVIAADKSISHRALMIGGLALGETEITGLLEGEDVLNTAKAMRQLGAKVVRHGAGHWSVFGRGVGGLAEPADILDMGNSGTGARLLMGLVASHNFTSFFSGDDSLRSRPMARITEPLTLMGARFAARTRTRLPLAVIGVPNPLAIEYRLPMASAQVKSAILLAGLNCAGKTIVIEPELCRDHTELMLQGFGASIASDPLAERGQQITPTGYPDLKGQKISIPRDPSAAAFQTVAALIVPGSEIILPHIGVNPLRIGLYTSLKEMGADIHMDNLHEEGGEPVADLTVRFSSLKAITVPASRAPTMIDEYPILAIAASFATGTTRLEGLKELRVKETDRLEAMQAGLTACGVTAHIENDDLIITGDGAPPKGGATVPVHFDHRIAMSFLVMGLASRQAITIDDGTSIATSFPDFVTVMKGLGAVMNEAT